MARKKKDTSKVCTVCGGSGIQDEVAIILCHHCGDGNTVGTGIEPEGEEDG